MRHVCKIFYTLFSASPPLSDLMDKAPSRVKEVFRPKMKRCYELLFKNFVGICVCACIDLRLLVIQHIIASLEYLVQNGTSVNMLANNSSAIRDTFVMLGLQFSLLDHPSIEYFIKYMTIVLFLLLSEMSCLWKSFTDW